MTKGQLVNWTNNRAFNKSMSTRTEYLLRISGSLCVIGITVLACVTLLKAKKRAESTACLNNLRQIGLAARLHANVNSDLFPTNFTSLRPWLPSPRHLFCPSSRAPVVDYWISLEATNATYPIVGPGLNIISNYDEVFVWCPIHGHLGLGDSSAQSPACYYKRSRKPTAE